MEVMSGTLILASGGISTGATFQVAAGATLDVTNGTSLSNCTGDCGLSFHQIAYLNTQRLGDSEHCRNTRV